MTYWQTRRFVVLLLLGGILLLPLAMERQRVRDETKVILPIEYVYSGTSRDGVRIRSAVLSAEFICNLDSTELEKLAPRVVEGLVRQLEDPEFVHHAATVLGCIGPPARAAAPALESALKKAEPTEQPGIVINPQYRLDNVIRSGLERVRGERLQ